MHWFLRNLFPLMWLSFFIYWQIASAQVKVARRLEPVPSRVIWSGLFLFAVLLFCFPDLPFHWLYLPILPMSRVSFYAGMAITLAGLLFAVWARRHLGANWSRAVTIKQGHSLITSGPYAWVRHPIYTGVLTGFLGTAVALTQVRGFFALLLIFIAFRLKWRLEEKWMREEFGEGYSEYARRVPAVIPRPI